MLPVAEFRGLRLSQFLPGEEIAELAEWEFLDRIWIGEAVGFTEWLRPAEDAESLGCVSLDLVALPLERSNAILARLDLPVRRGMPLEQLEAALGPALRQEIFIADRKTYYFAVREPDAYAVSCTVLNDVGLTYVVVAPVGFGLE